MASREGHRTSAPNTLPPSREGTRKKSNALPPVQNSGNIGGGYSSGVSGLYTTSDSGDDYLGVLERVPSRISRRDGGGLHEQTLLSLKKKS